MSDIRIYTHGKRGEAPAPGLPASISRDAYREWTPVRLADPREATVEQLIHGLELIVEAEGPVMASRAFTIFAKAGGLGRIYEPTRKRFVLALKDALRKGVFLSEREASEDPGTWILRPPSRQAVHVRELVNRTLHEVPALELAEIMLEIRVRTEPISKEELFRQVLEGYGLIRLTAATTDRLDYVLATWF